MQDTDPRRRRFLSTAALATAGMALDLFGTRASAEEKEEEEEEGIPPTEDLMREHGVLRRILGVYEEGARRIHAGQKAEPQVLNAAAALVKRFVEGYHEKLEEEQVFPRLEKARTLDALVKTLRTQHAAGRDVTARLLANTRKDAFAKKAARDAIVRDVAAFARMYRPHAAREDTVLFPAFRKLFDEKAFDALGEQFEAQEHKLLGNGGFEGALAEVTQLEHAYGLSDLAQFTPR
jgi:hemerythrin-like domain-containing protein